MFCSTCATPITEGQFRCSGCGRVTQAWRLKFYVALSWLSGLVMLYIAWFKLVPVLLTFMASLGEDFSWYMRLQAQISSYGFGEILLLVLATVVWHVFVRGKYLPQAVRSSLLPEVVAGLVVLGAVVVIVGNGRNLLSLANRHLEVLDERFSACYNAYYEVSAIDSIRRLQAAEAKHRKAHPEVGYTCDLKALAAVVRPKESETLPHPVISGSDKDYQFTLRGCEGAPCTRYQIEAQPQSSWNTQRVFCSDESGEIFFSKTTPTGACLRERTSWY